MCKYGTKTQIIESLKVHSHIRAELPQSLITEMASCAATIASHDKYPQYEKVIPLQLQVLLIYLARCITSHGQIFGKLL